MIIQRLEQGEANQFTASGSRPDDAQHIARPGGSHGGPKARSAVSRLPLVDQRDLPCQLEIQKSAHLVLNLDIAGRLGRWQDLADLFSIDALRLDL